MLRRFISVLLAVALCLSLVPYIDATDGHADAATPTYRALCIGNNWPESEYNIAKYSTEAMRDAFKKDSRYKKVYNYTGIKSKGNKKSGDALLNTTATFAQLIERAFKDATANDISVFYYVGYSAADVEGNEGESALWMADDGVITSKALKAALDKVKGKKIVILDVAGGGSHIAKGGGASNAASMDAFAKTFVPNAQARYGELAAPNYTVLVSSAAEEGMFYYYGTVGFGVKGRPMGVFSQTLAQALGDKSANSRVLADTNVNGNVTMDELFDYTKVNAINSSPKMYPQEVGTSIFKYSVGSKTQLLITNAKVTPFSGPGPYTLTFNLKQKTDLQVDVVYFKHAWDQNDETEYKYLSMHYDEKVGQFDKKESFKSYSAGKNTIKWTPNVDEYKGDFPYFNFAFAIKEKGSQMWQLFPFVYNTSKLSDYIFTINLSAVGTGAHDFWGGDTAFSISKHKEMRINVTPGIMNFSIEETISFFSINIYIDDSKGKRVRTLVEDSKSLNESVAYGWDGTGSFYWNAKNDSGATVSPGTYTIKVQASINGQSKTTKATVKITS